MKDTEAIEILKQMRKETPTMPYECLMNKEMEALDTLLQNYEIIKSKFLKLSDRNNDLERALYDEGYRKFIIRKDKETK